MRLPLALAGLLTLAACDSGSTGDAPAFVGSWTLTEARTETVVESRTDQSLLVLSGPATGTVTVSGDQTHTLTRAQYSAEPSIGRMLSLTPGPPPAGPLATTLILNQFTDDQGTQRAAATFVGVTADGSRTRTYRARLSEGAAPFSRDGDRLVVAALTMDDGEGRSVTASGALSFPAVQARAGSDTTVPGDGPGVPTSGTITLSQNGSVRLALANATTETDVGGRWTVPAPGQVSVPWDDGVPRVFDVEVAGGRLRLTESVAVTAACDSAAGCLATVEDEVFAERGTLASARRVAVYEFR